MTRSDNEPAHDAEHEGLEETSPEGVDLTLVRWMLSLTPRERLAWCQAQADAIRRVRALRSSAHDL